MGVVPSPEKSPSPPNCKGSGPLFASLLRTPFLVGTTSLSLEEPHLSNPLPLEARFPYLSTGSFLSSPSYTPSHSRPPSLSELTPSYHSSFGHTYPRREWSFSFSNSSILLGLLLPAFSTNSCPYFLFAQSFSLLSMSGSHVPYSTHTFSFLHHLESRSIFSVLRHTSVQYHAFL